MVNIFAFGSDFDVKEAKEDAEFRHGDRKNVAAMWEFIETANRARLGDVDEAKLLTLADKLFVEANGSLSAEVPPYLQVLGERIPGCLAFWRTMASHPDAKIRLRLSTSTATVKLPEPIRSEIFAMLQNDRSKKVRDGLAEIIAWWESPIHNPQNVV